MHAYDRLWRQGKLPIYETQDGGFLPFALSGWSSISQQIAKFKKRCPYANGIRNSPEININRKCLMYSTDELKTFNWET